jgi:hypothetical protein
VIFTRCSGNVKGVPELQEADLQRMLFDRSLEGRRIEAAAALGVQVRYLVVTAAAGAVVVLLWWCPGGVHSRAQLACCRRRVNHSCPSLGGRV